ncbi:hypothetical protein EON65_04655, partial [archaeon]
QAVENQPIVFESETDRIYQQASGHYQIVSALESTIDIQAQGCSSVVVWNPWAEKAARLGDMPSDSWQHMLCVECGQLGEANVHLAAGQSIAYQLMVRPHHLHLRQIHNLTRPQLPTFALPYS